RSSSLIPLSSLCFMCPAASECHTLSLHDALPIFHGDFGAVAGDPEHGLERDQLEGGAARNRKIEAGADAQRGPIFRQITQCQARSEEHTSELQSPDHLVCRLLLEKKNIERT